MGINLATGAMCTKRRWCEGTQGEHLVEAELHLQGKGQAGATEARKVVCKRLPGAPSGAGCCWCLLSWLPACRTVKQWFTVALGHIIFGNTLRLPLPHLKDVFSCYLSQFFCLSNKLIVPDLLYFLFLLIFFFSFYSSIGSVSVVQACLDLAILLLPLNLH